jgi:hypothetical protein
LFELPGYLGGVSLDLRQPANERVGLRRARLRGPPALQQSHTRNKRSGGPESVGGDSQERVKGSGRPRRLSQRQVAGLDNLAQGGVELHADVRLLLGPPVVCENPANASDQVSRADRLFEIVVCTELEAQRLNTLGGAAGEHQDRYLGVPPEFFEQLQTTPRTQVNVEHGEVELLGLENAGARQEDCTPALG